MTLDVDNTKGYGPENISVYVDEESRGHDNLFEISVQNYSKGNGTTATVYIFINDKLTKQESYTFTDLKEKWVLEPIEL